MAEPFRALARPQDSNPWLYVGHASTIPVLDGSSKVKLSQSGTKSDQTANSPSCHIVQLSRDKTETLALSDSPESLENQVLVLQYRGQFHAFDHQCPHQSYPLSRGSLHDIEDFGIILSAGITCPRHGWDFDIFTGESSRGAYQLKIWDVEVRSNAGGETESDDKQIWIRRRIRRREG